MESEQSPDRYNELAAKWLNGTITPEEIREYNDWYNRIDDAPAEVSAGFAPAREVLEARIFDRILKIVRHREPMVWRRSYWASAAAVALVMLAGGYWWYREYTAIRYPEAVVRDPAFRNDVLPGRDRAILTLSDGRRIELGGKAEGVIAREGAVPVSLLGDGTVSYGSEGSEAGRTNTLSAPRGAQYKMQLSDGTRVWLNAASSITFPVSFTEQDRRVSISGEVYFEVAGNKAKPFIVAAEKSHITVLGTHFNVNAYPDSHGVRTTLLEGSVRVSAQQGSKVLVPGQQSRIGSSGSIEVSQVNTEEVVGWKDGLFRFNNTDMVTLMQQVSRWYDIEVNYTAVPADVFSGTIPRSYTLTELLTVLRLAGTDFTLDKNKLTILPGGSGRR